MRSPVRFACDMFRRRPAPWWAHHLIANQEFIMSALDDIKASVQRAEDGEASAIALIQSLSQQIKDNANDPAALQALAADLDAHTAELTSALGAATTPTAPAPVGAGPDGAPVAVTSSDPTGSSAVEGDPSAIAPANPSGIAAPSPFGV